MIENSRRHCACGNFDAILLNFYYPDVIQRIVRLRHNDVCDYGDIRLL